ncbi:MAG TPA: thiazole synthase [Syntrophales bacterium]|nr:thiazole synthase [Syntrophales bacterium]
MPDVLKIGGKDIKNRLFVGTGKFASIGVMHEALLSARAEVATVALRRVDTKKRGANILSGIPEGCNIMVNTSGARNAEEAIRIARLARAGGMGNWIKIEITADPRYLLPDNMETLKATEVLAEEGFFCFPYVNPDLVMGRYLMEAGAAAVMPLGSPIGSNRGLKTREIISIMVKELPIPIIVDAGLGRPSHACECMEIGCAAVLVNTAIAIAEDPVSMARAFSLAVEAGRMAYLTGLPDRVSVARPSSPLTGFLDRMEGQK